jgi:hypothetical protein
MIQCESRLNIYGVFWRLTRIVKYNQESKEYAKMTQEGGRGEIERRKMVIDAVSSEIGMRPCQVCGRMFSVLRLALRLQPHTCPYCGS